MHDGETGAENKCDCGEDCHCGHFHGGMKSQWRMMKAVRTLTAVIVIIFVFWCGFEFGMIRASIGHEYGASMMRGGGSTMIGYGMMRGGVTTSVSGVAPATLNAVTVPAGGGGTNVQ